MNLARTILELQGTDCITIDDRDADRTGQIMFSRSFSTPMTDPTQMHQVLAMGSRQVVGQSSYVSAADIWRCWHLLPNYHWKEIV
ncbi:MAG: hypothetical protein L0K74_09330 [Acidipropionibacterium acidipropionici]|nr:hypothetical protein [Acidipropionibacterium acidipropionici]